MSTPAWLLAIALVWFGYDLGLCVAHGYWLALLVLVPIHLFIIIMIGRWAVPSEEEES